MQIGSPFTAKEDRFLSDHFREMDSDAMAKKLGRTRSSTQNRLRHLGLRKRATDKPTQTKTSIFFDDDLMPLIRAGAEKADVSMSAYVQELVRRALKNKKVT